MSISWNQQTSTANTGRLSNFAYIAYFLLVQVKYNNQAQDYTWGHCLCKSGNGFENMSELSFSKSSCYLVQKHLFWKVQHAFWTASSPSLIVNNDLKLPDFHEIKILQANTLLPL